MNKTEKILNNKITHNLIGGNIKFVTALINEADFFEYDGLITKIPFGKIAQYFIKKGVQISNKDEAFTKAYSMAWYISFRSAIFRYKIHLKGGNLNELEKKLKKIEKINIEEFLFENFWYGNIGTTDLYIGKYTTILKSFKIDEIVQKRVFGHIRNTLEINFWEFVEQLTLSYKGIFSTIEKTSFKKKQERIKLDHYYARLKNMYSTTVMGDESGMGLSDIYIEPNFRIHPYSVEDEKKFRRVENNKKRETAYEPLSWKGNIHEFSNEFINGNISMNGLKNADAKVMFVFGYPGQGKSSFIKRLIYDFCKDDQTFYFLPFKDIHNVDQFIYSPIDLIRNTLCNELNETKETINKNFDGAVLLLDGLDELAIRSGTETKKIDEACADFITWTEKKNVKVIITSRYGYLNYDFFKQKPGHLIVLLKEFEKEQQIEWLNNYKKFHSGNDLITEKDIEQYNNDERYTHIKELINQPILLHMVIESKVQLNIDANRSKLYDDLFKVLIKRKYAKKQVPLLEGIKEEDLRELIRDIALAVFHSEHEYISKKELLEQECAKTFIRDIIGRENLDGALKGLMIAFYFSETEKSKNDSLTNDRSEYAIEFLHKSLYEFMAAEKIWEECKRFSDYNDRRRKFEIDSVKEALELLTKLFEKKMLTNELVGYIREIAKNDKKAPKKDLEKRFLHFLPQLVNCDFMLKTNERDQYSVNIGLYNFFGFLTILSALDMQKNYMINEIKHRFIFLLKTTLSLAHLQPELRFLNMSKTDLQGANLQGANLQKVIFEGANLTGANLVGVNLENANLENANLKGANLENANLQGANLKGANLENANLFGVNLFGVNLKGANLFGAILFGANLKGTNLFGVNLFGANLKGANLKGASLDEATLQGANLRETNLIGANLKEANLQGANLIGANLKKAFLIGTDFELANLQGAILDEANLRLANLKDANLKGASLFGAKLKAANLEGVVLTDSNLIGATILQGSNLIGANLQGANLQGANLERANLKRANLQEANLLGANLKEAILKETNLRGANLKGAYFDKTIFQEVLNNDEQNHKRANLQEANLQNATLININLQGANLQGVNLKRAKLIEVTLGEANLFGAELQEACIKGTSLQGANFSRANFSGTELEDIYIDDKSLRKLKQKGITIKKYTVI